MPLRDVVQDLRFTTDFEMFQRNYPDMDDIYADMVRELQEQPSVGVVMNETFWDFRVYLTYPTDETPAFHVMYSYDIDHIYLHAIKKATLYSP